MTISKSNFYALYSGQLVVSTNNRVYLEKGLNSLFTPENSFLQCTENETILVLKNLHSITIEDAEYVGNVIGYMQTHFSVANHAKRFIKEFASGNLLGGCGDNIIHIIDYLRSKGYALPYGGWSVDELITNEWVYLKNSRK